ncbi:ScbR family autoregulator-binding transcription factor [Frondihabitans cladoniiphilus]|uniref:ScbR family autoregulator-binding transcription factor n=1 Tax=Frondihabitans cladoniiphilus TaxID=715785 RepID=A0ABP8VWZ4_9MICO
MPNDERPNQERQPEPREPRVARPRQERAQATQAAIIRAAASVFAERGYARTTLDVVAVEAGVTKGALYFHFASKHDLANAVISTEVGVIEAGIATVVAAGDTGLRTLVSLSSTIARMLSSDVVVQAGVKLTTEELVAHLDIEQAYAFLEGVYTRLFEQAILEGDVRAGLEATRLSRAFVSVFTGVQVVSAGLDGRASLVDRLRDVYAMLLPGILADDRRGSAGSLLELLDD